jgi:hypothetical protein
VEKPSAAGVVGSPAVAAVALVQNSEVTVEPVEFLKLVRPGLAADAESAQ